MEFGFPLQIGTLRKLKLSKEIQQIIGSENGLKSMFYSPQKRLLFFSAKSTMVLLDSKNFKFLKIIRHLPSPIDFVGPYIASQDLLILASDNSIFGLDTSRAMKLRFRQSCPFKNKVLSAFYSKPNLLLLIHWMDDCLAKNATIYDIQEQKFMESIFPSNVMVLEIFYEPDEQRVIGIANSFNHSVVYSLKHRQILYTFVCPFSFMSIVAFVPEKSILLCIKPENVMTNTQFQQKEELVCEFWSTADEKIQLISSVNVTAKFSAYGVRNQNLFSLRSKSTNKGQYLGKVGSSNYLFEIQINQFPRTQSNLLQLTLWEDLNTTSVSHELSVNKDSAIVGSFEDEQRIIFVETSHNEISFKKIDLASLENAGSHS